MSNAPKINIVARTNGVGLDRDVDLIRDILSDAGMEVTVSHCRGISPLRCWFAGKREFDANIFMERVFQRWLGKARQNILIPNQERFPRRHLGVLRHIDHIFCKSRHAEEIFREYGTVHFTGFTSVDMNEPDAQPDYQKFLHLAGKSTLKGTETILSLWEKHPEWPQLTLIQCEENAPASVPDNVRLLSGYLAEEEIIHHLNTHGIHLCTSLSEGWGHYIVEAMSCGVVVVTTDAPPMNELITPARGVPIPAHRHEPRHLGQNFYIDPQKLESQIQQLLMMPSAQKESIGAAAKAWFQNNQTAFPKRFTDTLSQILQQ